MNSDLVYIDEYSLLGSNFYWYKYEAYGLTKEDVLNTGLTSDRVQVHKDIVERLVNIDNEFKKQGFRLYIKEGYRSKELYEIVYKRRVEKKGQEETDRLMNMNSMPHAKGKSVDVALFDIKKNDFIPLRKNEDGVDALFINFYKDRTDEEGKRYQELQDLVINTMLSNGFKLGSKNEYFHFDFN